MYSFKTFDATNSEAATGRNPLYKTMSTPIFKKRKRQPSQSSGKLPFQMSTKSHASILTRVKMRKINEDIKVTPEIASQVVKEYLMPMFELEGRNIAAKSRSSLMGVNSKEMPERVVKCKLSDIILKQLNLTKEELENLNKRWKASEIERQKTKNEIDQLNYMLRNAICFRMVLEYQKCETKKSIKHDALNTKNVNMQINEFKMLTLQKEAERIQNGDSLNKERIRNTILNDKANELQHWNALLQMQNEIMGERLKGLFESYEDLADTIKSNEKMNGEHLTITSSFVNLAFFENKTKSETINSIKMCQDYIVQNNNLSFRREEYRNDVRRVKHNMKEMLNAKSKQKIQASEERDFLFEKCLNMEKKFKELNEGYAKVRINVKEMNQKRKQYGLDEEKLCKNCNKSYFEKDNYNWSCLLHASKWNGSMYWCCGKAKEESNGCIRSRHECRDDEDEENETGEDIDKINNSKKRCSSCREIGHFPHQCPKDPNARTNATQRDELDRIYFSKRRRERLGNSNSQMSLKIKTMLLYKDKDLLQVATNKLDFEDIDEFRLTALKSPRPDVYEISKKTIDKSNSPRNKAQRRSFPAGLDFNFESEFLGSPKNGEKQFGFKLHPITSEGI